VLWLGPGVAIAQQEVHDHQAAHAQELLPTLRRETVYVGVSGGSMAAAATFGETYLDPRRGSGEALTSEDIVFATPQGKAAGSWSRLREWDLLTLR
jgi:hypothetical protein